MKDMVYWLCRPPTGADQNLLNLLKCITALMNGSLKPDELKRRCEGTDTATFTAAIRTMIEADGARFLGAVGSSGVEVEIHPLVGPKTRPVPPTQRNPRALTVCQGDVGAQVQFLNFTNAFEKRAVYTCLKWGSILTLIIESYTQADCQMALNVTARLPQAAGSKQTRKGLRQMLHLGHYNRTGLDIFTGREPTEDTKAYFESLRGRL